MTVVDVVKDPENLQLTFVSEFDASVERVWQLWADPRQLERWWGPPTWPATFVEHDLAVDKMSKYYMTGPDGSKASGWWLVKSVDAPNRLTFDDGFADEEFEPVDPDATMFSVVTLEEIDGRTVMTIALKFTSASGYDKVSQMGIVEGLSAALGQIDAILAAV